MLKNNSFSLYIQLKDKIIFDHLLEVNGIEHSLNSSFETFGKQMFKYHLDAKKKDVVNKICLEEKIEWIEP